jgi:hypothetical protein
MLKLEPGNVTKLSGLMDNRVNSIPGTTGPGIPLKIRAILHNSYGGVNESATDFYGAAEGKLNIYVEFSCAIFRL